MGTFDRGQRGGCERSPAGRQQRAHHRLPGQSVPKPEPLTVHRQQQRRHRRPPRRRPPSLWGTAQPAARRRESSRGPLTAAICTTAARSGPSRSARRARTVSASDVGTPGAASSSSTRNGTPSEAPATRSTTTAAAPGRHASTIASTSLRPRRTSLTARTIPPRRQPVEQVDRRRAWLVPGRGAHNTLVPLRLSPRYSTTPSVSGSAQWRSSSTTTRAAGSARRRRSWSTASARATVDSSPCPSDRASHREARSRPARAARDASPRHQEGRVPPQRLRKRFREWAIRSRLTGGDGRGRQRR